VILPIVHMHVVMCACMVLNLFCKYIESVPDSKGISHNRVLKKIVIVSSKGNLWLKKFNF
jgi:hypothetical protein